MENVIVNFLKEILANPAITLPLVTFILSLVPGPFKGVAQALINWLLERTKNELEQRKNKAVSDAVRGAEQIAQAAKNKGKNMSSDAKKNTALANVVQRVQIRKEEASARIEAEVQRLNEYQKMAEAEFARIAGK